MFPYWLHTFYWSVWLKTPDFGLAIEFVPSLQRWNNFIVDKHGQCDCLTSMSVFESDQFVIQHSAISFFSNLLSPRDKSQTLKETASHFSLPTCWLLSDKLLAFSVHICCQREWPHGLCSPVTCPVFCEHDHTYLVVYCIVLYCIVVWTLLGHVPASQSKRMYSSN